MKFKEVFSKENVVRALLLICSVTILSFFLPETNKFKYEYAVGKPWAYDLITAPEDNIIIDLDSATMKHRRDSVDTHFRNVYRRDAQVGMEKIQAFNKKMTDLNFPAFYRNQISRELTKIYEEGIVSNEVYDKIQEKEIKKIKIVVNENKLEQEDAIRMYSEKGAYEAIDSVVPYLLDPFKQLAIAEYLTPNVIRDTVLSEKLRNEAYSKVLAPEKVLIKGERIIDRGEIVTPEVFSKLKACQKVIESRSNTSEEGHYPRIGQIAFILILLVFNYMFFKSFRCRFYNDLRKMTFMMLLITLFTVAVYFASQRIQNGVYMVPFVMIPILLTVFFDSRTAMYVHITEIFLCTLVVTNPIEFVFIQFVAGITAITSLRELSRRSELIRCALLVLLSYCITYAVFVVVKDGNIMSLNYRMFIFFLVNSVLLSFTYIVIFIFEKLFGFISTVTLVELSDVSNPILRELSEDCPGTFQHSLQVSSLAAEAAQKINANVQLVRAGALYHDIGKLNNPNFFTENQIGPSPHAALTPEQSASIVINHVTDGLARAEKHKLPSVIKDFISQHHGRGTAKYFYTIACNNNPDCDIDIEKFTYPGPNPTSKETAILMMADSTEAASRSLREYDEKSIRDLVNKIVNSQIADGLLNNSPLSFKDVEIVKETFINRLKSMYHTRVSYPELKKQK